MAANIATKVLEYPVIQKTENQDKGGKNVCFNYYDIDSGGDTATPAIVTGFSQVLFAEVIQTGGTAYTAQISWAFAAGVATPTFSAAPNADVTFRVKLEGYV